MTSIPPPKTRRPSTRPPRLDEVSAAVAAPGWDPRAVLETLLLGLGKGAVGSDVFLGVLAAAQRDDVVADLVFAFEELTQDRRTKMLAPPAGAELYFEAALASKALGDADGSLAHAERAFALHAAHSGALDLLIGLLEERDDVSRLAKVLVDAAAHVREPDAQRGYVRRAGQLALLIDDAGVAIDVLTRAAKLVPDEGVVRTALESRLADGGRHKELARLLETSLAKEGALSGEETLEIRRKVARLYLREAAEPARSVPHVEAWLAAEPGDEEALAAAESLLEAPGTAARAAAALSDAYERTGRHAGAAAMLARELKLARGPRRTEVQRRLAILRQDRLDDPQGAFELLGPMIAGDAGDDALRGRFVELAAILDQPLDAAKLLSRALAGTKDAAARARVGLALGRMYSKAGDARQARAAYQQVVDSGQDGDSVLEAARELVEAASGGEPGPLIVALERVVRLEAEGEPRHAAARRLARLAEDAGDRARAISAWRALVDSPWVDESLRRLEQLCRDAGDAAGLGDVLERRAARSKEPAQRRELLLAAADEFEERARDRAGAIRCLAAAIGAGDGAQRPRLAKLLEAERRWQDLAQVLQAQVADEQGAARAAVLSRLASVQSSHLGDPTGAAQAIAQALQLAPDDRALRGTAERLLGGEAGGVVADALEPIYRREGASLQLARLLEVRGARAETLARRLAALDEAVRIAREDLADGARALELAGKGLVLTLASEPERAATWLERVQSLAEVCDPTLRARTLQRAADSAELGSPEALAVVLAAADALENCGDRAAALALLRRAVARDPGSSELVTRLDDLLTQQGSPEERLALYQSSLAQPISAARRRQILHALARLWHREVGDVASAIDTWTAALGDDPRDATAHTALVELLDGTGDQGALYDELARMLGVSDGDRRAPLLARMAEVSAAHGRAVRALEHYRELVQHHDVEDRVLADAAGLARERGDAPLARDATSRRIAQATTPAARAALGEALAEAWLIEPADPVAALAALREAVAQGETDGAAPDVVRRSLVRIVELDPQDTDATLRLAEGALAAGDWDVAGGALGRVAERDPQGAARLVLTAAASADDAALEPLADLAARVLASGEKTGPFRRELTVARARLLARREPPVAEVATVYRGLLEDGGDDARVLADELGAWLARARAWAGWSAARRWLWEWLAARATDPVMGLLDWAHAEEQELGEPRRALALFERVLERSAERVDVLGEIARLRAATGDVDGALAALAQLRARGGDGGAADLRIAGLLVDLGRADEALDVLADVLAAQAADPDALRLVSRVLGYPSARARAAQLLDRAANTADDPEVRATVLEALLALPPMAELADARARWYHALLATRADDAEARLDVALRGALEIPGDEALWEVAERAARRLDRPQPVAEAYGKALDAELSEATTDLVGRRVVEFHEEWFDDPERVTDLLRRVVALAPGAAWAFDRLKLAYNAAARWDDLFALYDAALERASDDAERVPLLREAAMAAKDFASEPRRALGYLEHLDALAPGDPRVEQALERLYERQGLVEPLIKLLTRRLHAASGRERQGLRTRIATLWLDLGQVMPAYELASAMLSDDEEAPDAIGLLERLVETPAARDSVPPDSLGKRRKKRLSSVRELVAARLVKHYESGSDWARVLRMMEVELEVVEGAEARCKLLDRIAAIAEDRLGDPAVAFQAVARRVSLDPTDDRQRARLAALATAARMEAERAELCVSVARGLQEPELAARILCEAAEARRDALGEPLVAATLFEEALALPVAGATALDAARALDALLAEEDAPARHADALTRLAELETERDAILRALGALARLAQGPLSDPARAVLAWRRRAELDPADRESLDGLCEAYERLSDRDLLIAALEARAAVVGGAAARADRVRAARQEEAAGRADRAIRAWERVRAEHGRDDESFEALAAVLTRAERARELAELIEADAALEESPERKQKLLARLGELWRTALGDPARALDAFARAPDWERAVAVTGDVHGDAEAAITLSSRLLDHAAAAWTGALGDARGAARAATWAIDELLARLTDRGRHDAVVDLLLRAAALPVGAERARELRRDAGLCLMDRLDRAADAVAIFEALVAEDAADEVAQACIARLVGWFESAGRHADVATLWERQAVAREARGESAAAAVVWGRAADLCEERLGDVDRALGAHRRAAELGREASYEALARLHGARGEQREALAALEHLYATAPREVLGQRALDLAAALVALGDSAGARQRLESASTRALDGAAVRRRLAELYRVDHAWAPLADLLVIEAQRAPGAAQRSQALREAARLHWDELGDPGRAAPLLEQAVEVDPDDDELRLRLARALSSAGRLAEAEAALRAQLARYGSRRPKERALAHHALAEVLARAERREEARAELELAARIDPAHPGILYALGRLAFETEDLERAERTYRSLLLVLRPGGPGPSRAAVLLDLSEIAVRRDDPVRATEFIESAFESALESPGDALELERALGDRGRYELLTRAVETRLSAATRAEDAARALSDLVKLHAERLGSLGERKDSLRGRALELETRLADATDDAAWAALGSVFDLLGDAEREVAILARRVQTFKPSGPNEPDPDALYRLAEVRLGQVSTREDGLAVLERALGARPDARRITQALAPLADEAEVDPRVLDLLERAAREAGDARALGAALVRRIEGGSGDAAVVRECVEQALASADAELAERALGAALAIDLGRDDAAWARQELARLREEAGDLPRALDLHEAAAELREPGARRAALLDVARRRGEIEDDRGAARVYALLLQDEPGDRELWEPLLGAYRKLGDGTALAALIEATVPLVDAREDRARLRFEQARALIDADREADAISALREILLENPAAADAAAVLEELLVKAGRGEELTELLVTRLDAAKDAADPPTVRDLCLRLGGLYEAANREDDALDAYRAALDWDAQSGPAGDALARLYRARGDGDALGEVLAARLAVVSGPSAAALALELAALRDQAGNAEDALGALAMGFERAPGDVTLADAYFTRLEQGERWSDLGAALAAAEVARPDDASLRARRIDVLRKAGDAAGALAAVEALLDRSEPTPDLVILRAALLSELGRDDEAVAELERAMLEGIDADAALTVALTNAAERGSRVHALQLVDRLVARGDLETARTRAEALARRDPGDLEAIDALATIETGAERWDAAARHLGALVVLASGEAVVDVALRLADVCLTLGDPVAARAGLERAFQTAPDRADVRERLRSVYQATGERRSLARLYVMDAESEIDPAARRARLLDAADLLLGEGGDEVRALGLLERLRADFPDDLEIGVTLARAYAATRRGDQALELLEGIGAAHAGRRVRTLAPVFHAMARIQLDLGAEREALTSLTRAFDADLRSGQLALELAELAMALGERETALKAYRSISMMKTAAAEGGEGASHEAKAEAHYQLALSARDLGDPRKAKLLVMKALSERADHPGAKELLDQL